MWDTSTKKAGVEKETRADGSSDDKTQRVAPVRVMLTDICARMKGKFQALGGSQSSNPAGDDLGQKTQALSQRPTGSESVPDAPLSSTSSF